MLYFCGVSLKSKSSQQLKSAPQPKKSLRVQSHIYDNGKRIKKPFKYDVKDTDGSVIKLLPEQLPSGLGRVINHELSIRYNELIEFIHTNLDTVLNKHAQTIRIDPKKGFRNVNEELKKLTVSSFEKYLNDKLHNQKVKWQTENYGVIEVDKEVYENFTNTPIPKELTVTTDNEGEIIDIDLHDYDRDDFDSMIMSDQMRHDNLKREKEIQAMTNEDRFKKGYFNRSDLAELFASIKYDEKISNVYSRLAIRIYEYKYFQNISTDIQLINTDWVLSFFTYLSEKGYHRLNTSTFNPFDFDPTIFKDKKILRYKHQNLFKMIEQFQTVIIKICSKEVQDRIDFNSIVKHFEKEFKELKSKDGQRKNHYLTKSEFDQLFDYSFHNSDKKTYQEVFDSFGTGIKCEVDENLLAESRDMFCLQTMIGGLRGYDEYLSMNYYRGQGEIGFYSSKVKKHIFNPLNEYTEIILRDNNNEIPLFSVAKKYELNTQKLLYRTLLKTLAHVLNFNRVIPLDDGSRVEIKNVFNGYWARKTFPHIMYTEFGLLPPQIEIFTGHAPRKTELTVSYLDMQSPEVKKKYFADVLVPVSCSRKPLS